jgi:hypothetical protein
MEKYRKKCSINTCAAIPAGLALFAFLASTGSDPHAASEQEAGPVTITAGSDWVALDLELDIEAGSALDFSNMGFQDAPAGKHGRVIARRDGQFAFESNPEIPRRFYGVNFCFGAQYLSHDEADKIALRLTRLGYNTARLHHYEGILAEGQPNTTTFNPERLDQLDYLVAAFAKRGIYVSTDLFTSRPVKFSEIGEERTGNVGMDHFKVLIPVHKGAWENWKQFSRTLLQHVNPYTNRRYSAEPALAWLSLINEGNFGNFVSDIATIPEWNSAWNVWLTRRYSDRSGLAEAWKGELEEKEDPGASSVRLPARLDGSTRRVRDCILFLSDVDRDFTERMIRFVREEMGCKALLTNTNSWTNFPTSQSARMLYDYVDDHFYVDHPQFLEKSWQLPSRNLNTSPVAAGAAGGRDRCFTRLFDKPFTITEYNYSGPGRFRGVGGILTGALGALQAWAGIWRFAYSHERETMFRPAHIDYFDMASDPLSQASERASMMLFVRGDMQPARDSIAVVMTDRDLKNPPDRIFSLAPRWHWVAWIARIGTQVVSEPKAELPFTAFLPLQWDTPASSYAARNVAAVPEPYSADNTAIVSLLQNRRILPEGGWTDPAQRVFQSATREITLDAGQDMMTLDTPRTGGGYAPAGQTIRTSVSGVTVKLDGSDATVWVSSLDGRPIRTSGRLLVTHLTDLQNTGIRYAEASRRTLLDWGRLPHLVRSGRALLEIRSDNAAELKVWALSTSGKRVGEISAQAEGGILRFQLSVGQEKGACLSYEVSEAR